MPVHFKSSSMPTYKLTYFDGRGKGEVARQLFHLSGTPFEDHRIPLADWPALKPKMLFNQLPLLEVDGQQLTQSYAINRYLANEFGFVGDSPFEAAWVDAIADQHKDYFNEIFPALAVYAGFVEGDQEKLVKDVAIPARDKYFGMLEKMISEEKESNGHFVGSSLTWVDLLIADHAFSLQKYIPGFLDQFPFVLMTVLQIESTSKLKEWIEKRPETAF